MSRVRRDIEAMADLLLGPATGPQPDQVTVLIDGNLPSRGDSWRAAAAEIIAGQGTGTCLQARFGELDAVQIGREVSGAPRAAGDSLSSYFESAPPGHRWVISTGGAVDGGSLAGVDEVALVTGVDEAAIVAGYALLKQLLIDCPGPTPAISLILAGTASMDAGDRLVRTARARLGVEPTVLGCLPQVDGTHRRWQRMTLPEGGMGAVVSMVVAAAGSRLTATGERPSAEDVPAPVEQPAPSPVGHGDPVGTPVAASAPKEPLVQQPGSGVRPLPEGLVALGVVCPWAPDVVFATDPQGSLHAVAPAALLADLVAALAWAAQHAAMLSGGASSIGAVEGHVLVGDVHAAAVLRDGPWPVHLVIQGPQGPVVLPAQARSLLAGPSAGTVPGWSSNKG